MLMWHTYYVLETEHATRRIVTIAKAIRPITYKKPRRNTPGIFVSEGITYGSAESAT